LRFFDQIQFYPVSAEELLEAREAFPHGQYPLKIEQTMFSFADYKTFLIRESDSIAAFKDGQQRAFEAERQRWRDDKIDEVDIDLDGGPIAAAGDVPEGHVAIYCEAPGSVWKVLAKEGSQIQAGDTLMIVESMKMEIAIQSTSSGIVRKVSVRAGQIVNAGDQVCILQES
jgi:urea carboxylase